jgi:peptidoglycan/xylan/chitin deacetylase (PgdA/CDA1 family)
MFRQPIPFRERNSALQKKMEVLSGKMPAFLFGGGLGHSLPVFRFSRMSKQLLEPYLVYLMENGYQTLNATEMEDVLFGRRKLEKRSVVLTFDHAWASVWTVVAPLLRRYDQQAVTFAIPGRIPDLPTCRPVWGEGGHDPDVDNTTSPFCSWCELKVLAEEGRVDVQSNSWSHGKIFSNEKFLSLIEPETRLPPLSWPMINDHGDSLHLLSPSNVFHPLLPARSRLSDALKHEVDPSVVARIHDDPDAAPYLFRQHFLQFETPKEREEAIQYELNRSREELELRLGTPVHQLGFPWGVCGKVAASLVGAAGYRSAYAERTANRFSVRAGQAPFRLGRLPYFYIRALPGRSRKLYWRIRDPEIFS